MITKKLNMVMAGIVFALFAFPSCKSTDIVKEKEYVYIYQPFADSLKGQGDTVVQFQKIEMHDTVFTAKYYPKTKYLTVKSRGDTVRIKDTVNVKQIIEKKIETPFLSKMGFVCIGIIITALLFIFRKFL